MGRHMQNPLKNLGEIGAVFEAHAPAYRLNRFPILQHQAGVGHPDAVQIIHVGDPGQGFEPAAKVILAVSRSLGHLVNGNFPGIILVGPVDQLL